jgi:hypothetical protein
LVLAVVWLGLLTLVVVLLVRQLGVLAVKLSLLIDRASLAGYETLLPLNGKPFSFSTDGPEIGSPVPSEVLAGLPQLQHGATTALFFSSTCQPCRQFAVDLQHHPEGPGQDTVALIAGADEERVEELAALLPSSLGIVRDPLATEVATALNIHSVPFGFRVEEGVVVKRTFLRNAADFLDLGAGSWSPNTRNESPREVSHVG